MRVGLLAGDPTGIGPEVAARLLAMPETSAQAEIILVGDRQVFRSGARIAKLPGSAIDALSCIDVPWECEAPMGRVNRDAGAFVLHTLRHGAQALRQNEIDALLFAPLNKQAMKSAGLEQEDEMHYFAALLQHAGYCSEINIADSLWTTRVTSHVPLRSVPELITEKSVLDAILLIDHVMRAERRRAPRVAVAGLNPHAGEGGLLGVEEIQVIGPAVESARAAGVDVSGPFPADTIFLSARRGDYDAVVTMYHDQGQIATKLLGFDRGVTLHAGLPFPIATPAHGTAFDIAGKGVAGAGAIRAAFSVVCGLLNQPLKTP